MVWENSHIIPKLKPIWDIFGKMPINFSYLISLTAPTPPISRQNKSVVMRGRIPRCWYVQDLPAVAAWVKECSLVNLRALCQKLCSHYAHWSISGHCVKSYAHVMLTGQSPGIESKVMLTLCSLVKLRALCQKLCSLYAHFMLIGQSPVIPQILKREK